MPAILALIRRITITLVLSHQPRPFLSSICLRNTAGRTLRVRTLPPLTLILGSPLVTLGRLASTTGVASNIASVAQSVHSTPLTIILGFSLTAHSSFSSPTRIHAPILPHFLPAVKSTPSNPHILGYLAGHEKGDPEGSPVSRRHSPRAPQRVPDQRHQPQGSFPTIAGSSDG